MLTESEPGLGLKPEYQAEAMDLSGRQLLTSAAAGLWSVLTLPPVKRLIGIAAFVAAFAWTTTLVKADVAEMEHFKVPLSDLALGKPPSFLSDAVSRDVDRLALPQESMAAFDDRLVPTVAFALSQLPWVGEVEEVRLRYPGKLDFKLKLLKPTALTRVRGRMLAVSKDVRFFPETYVAKGERGSAPTLPEVSGIDPIVEGREALMPVLALVERLRARGLLLKAEIRGIDASNVGGRVDPRATEIRLVTAQGMVIDWGRLEGSRRLHPSFAERAERLEAFLSTGPSPKTVRRLSLRWERTSYELRPVPEKGDEVSMANQGQ